MHLYQVAIQDCKNYFSQFPELYDILLRGTSCEQESLIENWSDIDITLVFYTITPELLRKINGIYKKLSDQYNFKISITIVTKKDFFSSAHHHGIKPLYYNKILSGAISLFNKEMPMWNIDFEYLRFDCSSNLAYLIHELRSSYLKLDVENKKAVEKFALHLLKRTKHLIRNAIYIESGYIGEEINKELFTEIFPDLDFTIPNVFEFYKLNWGTLNNSNDEINKIIHVVLHIAEQVYECSCKSRNEWIGASDDQNTKIQKSAF